MSAVISVTATIAAVTMAISFAQKADADSRKKAAESEAEKKMEDARAALKINYADELSIAKEPYERQREAMLAQGAQIMEQAVESERGGAATAGRVLAAQQEGQGQVRDAQNQDLFNLEAAQAEEDSRLRDINVDMDLGQIAGAQQAAAEAQESSNRYKQQGIDASLQLAGTLATAVPGYGKSSGERTRLKSERIAGRMDTTLDQRITDSFSAGSGIATGGTTTDSWKLTDGKFVNNQTTTGAVIPGTDMTLERWQSMKQLEKEMWQSQNPSVMKQWFQK